VVRSLADWSHVQLTWCLFRLETLCWATGHSSHGDFAFLRQCQFSGLRSVKLRSFTTHTTAASDIEVFRDFIQSATSAAAADNLELSCMSERHAIVFPHLRARILELVNCRMDSEAILSFPPIVRHLRIRVSGQHIAWLWLVLEALTTHPNAQLRIETVQFTTAPDFLVKFTWGMGTMDPTRVSLGASGFVGRLVVYAIRLGQRGISVCDEDGNTLYLKNDRL
jgi:hypothetical protein